MPRSDKTPAPVKRSRGRPRLVEKAAIERSLLEFALAEFLEHGYGGASISRMVRRAGISKTTLYSRYESKEAIFRAIIEQQIENLSPQQQLSANGERLTLEEGFRRYANHMLTVSLTAEVMGINRLMYSESHRFPELAEAAALRTRMGIDRITSFIRECAEQQQASCQNPRAVAEVFILSMRGWYVDAVLGNRRVTARERQAWVDKTIHVLMSAVGDW